MRYKTLIIDDEPPARRRLTDLLATFPDDFEIIGEAENGTEGLAKIRELNPDLIFLDIQMPGLSGFEMLHLMDKAPIIVFCTAYDQYALQAFETNGMDYLIKPVRRERLEQCIGKLHQIQKKTEPLQIQVLLQKLSALTEKKPLTSLTIRRGNKMLFVKLSEVAYMEASDKCVSLFTDKGTEFITDYSLVQLEEKLPAHFLRIHRSTLINTRFIAEMERYFNGRYVITLKDDRHTRLTSGRNYQGNIKEWMDDAHAHPGAQNPME